MKWNRMSGLALGLAGALTTPSLVQAHICLDLPMSRVGPSCEIGSPQKTGPCGIAGRSKYVATYRPGETITVKFHETIPHPSHYRIAFNPSGDTFEDPTGKDDKNGGHPHVLVDGIMDLKAGNDAQSVQVTLPNVTCDNCTLQLIQYMYDKSHALARYYACADIVLKGAPVDGGAPAADAGSARGSDAGLATPGRPDASSSSPRDAGPALADARPPATEPQEPDEPDEQAPSDEGEDEGEEDDGEESEPSRDAGTRADSGKAAAEPDDDAPAPAADGCSVSHAGQGAGSASGLLLTLALLLSRRRRRAA